MSNIAETLTASGFKKFSVTGRFVRLMSSTGSVEIVYFLNGSEIARTGSIQAGYAEEFDEVFDSFIIYDKSGSANAVELLYRMSSRARYDRSAGNVNVVSTPGSPVYTENSGAYAASHKATAYLAANVPEQIFSAAANVNGAVILSANQFGFGGIPGIVGLMAKSTAPTGILDGDVIASDATETGSRGAKYQVAGIRIPAGKGLYFLSTFAETYAMRSCLYKLL